MSFFKHLENALESLDQSAASAFSTKTTTNEPTEKKSEPSIQESTVTEVVIVKDDDDVELTPIPSSSSMEDQLHPDEENVDIDTVRSQLTDQIKRLLLDKENTDTSYQMAMEKKDTHIASLQRRVDELLHQVKQKTALISDIQQEKNDLLTKQLNASSTQANTVAQLEDEASALNTTIEFYKTNLENEKVTAKRELEHLKSQLATTKESLKYMTEERDTLEYEQNKTMQLCQEYEVKHTKLSKEFASHKQRANSMLKKKEELLRRLQSEPDQSASVADPTNSTVMQQEYDQLAMEFKEVSTKLLQSNQQLDDTVAAHHDAILALKKELKKERDGSRQLQLANRKLTLSNDQLSKELYDANTSHQQKMTTLKNENAKLSLKMHDHASPVENLKQKLTILSNRLIEKNSQNEMLRSEKATLKLKLSKAEQSLTDVQLAHRVGVKHTDRYQAAIHRDEEAQFVNIHSAIPVRTQKYFHAMNNSNIVVRRLALWLHDLDRLSLSIGQYLRKLPLFRVVVLLYFILLHLWVILIVWQQQHALQVDALPPTTETIQASSTIKP